MLNDLSERQLQSLHTCLEVQEREEGKDGWQGFLWSEVHSPPATLNSLVSLGLLDLSEFSSRAYKYYRINDKAKTHKILDAYNQGQPPVQEDDDLIIPHDLFDIVIGHEQTKNILKMSLLATDPVHCLLVGEPATAKTLLLNELARLPGSRLALGGTSSRAGIVDFLIDVRPRYLIIDEIDKANGQDMDVLLSLMETGLVTRLKKGMREQTKIRTWVYAGANSDRYLTQALVSRFIVRHMPKYTQQDFKDISRAFLTKSV
ncbi:hypothetical protein, partial [Nocardioides sp.]|uniref:hypothetical protein n=1 Tax=Nocardioides sp. TaxID=35761 RepID=UPI00273672BE